MRHRLRLPPLAGGFPGNFWISLGCYGEGVKVPFGSVMFILFSFLFCVTFVPFQEQLCLPLHILEEKGLSQVAVTVQALLELAPPKQTQPQQQQPQLSAV